MSAEAWTGCWEEGRLGRPQVRASWVLRGSRVSHSTCLRRKRCAKGTPEKCVSVRLLWQPGLFL